MLERLGAISDLLEVHCRNALGAALSIVVEGHGPDGANGRVEELLQADAAQDQP